MNRSRSGLSTFVAACGVVLLAACSSDNGVSESKLESKIKSEPSIQSVLNQGGTKADVADALVQCIAQALRKDADQDDLKKYVDGKLNLSDVGGRSKGSALDAQADAKTCAQSAVSSIASTAANPS
jgi:hypothetical protein